MAQCFLHVFFFIGLDESKLVYIFPHAWFPLCFVEKNKCISYQKRYSFHVFADIWNLNIYFPSSELQINNSSYIIVCFSYLLLCNKPKT